MTSLILWDWSGTLCIEKKLNPDAKFDESGLNCIVSNHIDKNDIIKWCQTVQIDKIFLPNQIICSQGGIKKPDIRVYLKLLSQIGPVQVSDLTVIGDSNVDLLFAKNLGAKFIHVSELKL